MDPDEPKPIYKPMTDFTEPFSTAMVQMTVQRKQKFREVRKDQKCLKLTNIRHVSNA